MSALTKALVRFGPGPVLGALLIGGFVLVALFGPFLAPDSPTAQHLGELLQGPSRAHLLGTDENGCDVLSQALFGARLAAAISLLGRSRFRLKFLVPRMPGRYCFRLRRLPWAHKGRYRTRTCWRRLCNAAAAVNSC